MLKKILLVVAVIILAILAFAATKPDSFRVARTTHINAPAAKIYPYLADFHQWTMWSPFEKLDPGMQRTYGGAPSGAGATYAWSGNSQAGSGDMKITRADSAAVVVDLHFTKPIEANNVAEFTLAPSGTGTDVTWAMSGPSKYVHKLMTVFFSMDKMVGGSFETGLANLKTVAER